MEEGETSAGATNWPARAAPCEPRGVCTLPSLPHASECGGKVGVPGRES